MGLSWLQPTPPFLTAGDAQHHGGEGMETGDGHRDYVVTRAYVAVAVLCPCRDFSRLLYRSAKSKCYANIPDE